MAETIVARRTSTPVTFANLADLIPGVVGGTSGVGILQHLRDTIQVNLNAAVLTTPQINDTSLDHQYIFGVSELAADRTVKLPLLIANDEFVFKDHIVTFAGKTFNLSANTLIGTLAQFNAALQGDSFVTLAGGVTMTGDFTVNGGIISNFTSELTISGGVVTITQNSHTIDTEADAATDDLDTINGFKEGQFLLLQQQGDSKDVTVKHNTGNILLAGGADFVMAKRANVLMLMYSLFRAAWCEVSRSSN